MKTREQLQLGPVVRDQYEQYLLLRNWRRLGLVRVDDPRPVRTRWQRIRHRLTRGGRR